MVGQMDEQRSWYSSVMLISNGNSNLKLSVDQLFAYRRIHIQYYFMCRLGLCKQSSIFITLAIRGPIFAKLALHIMPLSFELCLRRTDTDINHSMDTNSKQLQQPDRYPQETELYPHKLQDRITTDYR